MKAFSLTKAIEKKIANLFKGGFFHVLFGNFFGKAVSMIASIVIVRLVDKTQYAYLAYADNIYGYINLVSGLGLSNALLLFSSPAKNNYEKNHAYYSYSLKYGGGFDFSLAVLVCIAIYFSNIPFPQAKPIIYALVFIPFFTYFFTNACIFVRTYSRHKVYANSSLAYVVMLASGSIVLALLLDVLGIIIARYFSVIVISLVLSRYIKQEFPPVKNKYLLNHDEKHAFWRTGLSLMATTVFASSMPLNDAFIINNFIKDSNITANFRVAGLFPQMLRLVTGAIVVYFFPVISNMNNKKEIFIKVKKIALLNAAVIFVLMMMGMALNPFLIVTFYGSNYSGAIGISYVLWFTYAMNAIVWMVPLNMLQAIRKTKIVMIVSFVSIFFQLLLAYVFVNIIGVHGVALGSAGVYLLAGLFYWIYFARSCNEKDSQHDNL